MQIQDERPTPRIQYNLPLLWSLCYALTDKQWKGLRDRHKVLFPDWEKCDCPKQCSANTLDEHWEYSRDTHTKTFVGGKYICPGCHWLKSPTWRIQTWRKPPPLPSDAVKPPHIIDCLGWSQERVDGLRKRDLREESEQVILRVSQLRQIQDGKAAIVPSPLERLSPTELNQLSKDGQVLIVPWKIDLSQLNIYGYSPQEIAAFEVRMYRLAAKRMTER